MSQASAAVTDYETVQRFSFFKTVPLFAGLGPDALAGLNSAVREETFGTGARIVTEDERGDALYILLEGQADVLVGITNGLINVAQLAPPDFFGEMALFEDEPRSATVITRTPCRVLALTRADFVELVARHPEILWNMCAVFARRLRATNRLAHAEAVALARCGVLT